MNRPVVQRADYQYLLGLLAKSLSRGRDPENTLEWAWFYGLIPDVIGDDPNFTLEGRDWVGLLLEHGETLEHGVVS